MREKKIRVKLGKASRSDRMNQLPRESTRISIFKTSKQMHELNCMGSNNMDHNANKAIDCRMDRSSDRSSMENSSERRKRMRRSIE